MKLFLYIGPHNLLNIANTLNLTFTNGTNKDYIPFASQLRIDLSKLYIASTLSPGSDPTDPNNYEYGYTVKVSLNGREFQPCAAAYTSDSFTLTLGRCLFKDFVEIVTSKSFYG